MKLYDMSVTFRFPVLALSEEDAVQCDYSDCLDSQPVMQVDEILSLRALPKAFRGDCIPLGDHDDDMTCEELLRASDDPNGERT